MTFLILTFSISKIDQIVSQLITQSNNLIFLAMVKRAAEPETEENAENIDSDFSDSDDAASVSDTESVEESAQGKRLRLAKQYLDKLEGEQLNTENDSELNRDLIAHRLQQDVLAEKGKLEIRVGKRLCVLENKFTLKGHRKSPTSLAITDTHLFSSSKDGAIIKWDITTGKKVTVVKHDSKKQILALAASSDNMYLASGGEDKMIILWDIATMTFVKCFRKHRGAITALAFRRNSHLLMSGSTDRSVILWNCDDKLYIESLYGHQDIVTGMDSFLQERVVTVGGQDKTLRLWKIQEESQLVFNGHKNTVIDCVSMLNEEHFVTGSQDNVLCVWHIKKKKPAITELKAHAKGSWISAVAALKNTECFISGSNGGNVKIWACAENYRAMALIKSIDVVGTVNSIVIPQDNSCFVLGVGQEPKMGRWWCNKDARNRVLVYPMVIEDEEVNR